MKAVIDRSSCLGCGLCTEICPQVFRLADDGLSEAYAQIGALDLSAAEEARDNCPASVISLTD